MARGPIQEISSVTHNLEQAVELARADNLPAFVWAGLEVRYTHGKSGLTSIRMVSRIRPSDAGRGAVNGGPSSEL